MTDDAQPYPRPATYKTQVDGRGGLVRVMLVGEPHDGRELFIDEKDLPAVIYASGRWPFEWWPARLNEAMAGSDLGADAGAPPVRYVLRVPDDTREPLYVAEADAR